MRAKPLNTLTRESIGFACKLSDLVLTDIVVLSMEYGIVPFVVTSLFSFTELKSFSDVNYYSGQVHYPPVSDLGT